MHELVFYATIAESNGEPALQLRKILTKTKHKEIIKEIVKEIAQNKTITIKGEIQFYNPIMVAQKLKEAKLLD